MPHKDPEERKVYRKAYHEANRERAATCSKVYRKANLEKIAIRKKAHHKAHPEQERARKWKWKYKLSAEGFNALLKKQDNVCAICQKPERNGQRLAVDHNHTTGKIRGLLCSFCNRAIGMFEDSPVRLRLAAEYLKKEVCNE